MYHTLFNILKLVPMTAIKAEKACHNSMLGYINFYKIVINVE